MFDPFAALTKMLAQLRDNLIHVTRCPSCRQRNRIDGSKMLGAARFAVCRRCGVRLSERRTLADGSVRIETKGID